MQRSTCSKELFTISKTFSKSGDSLHRETNLSLIQAIVSSSGEHIIFSSEKTKPSCALQFVSKCIMIPFYGA